ncbi:MAG TPA: C1 family peptidase [Bacteroidia bacterium]|jgi:C1A family cysteine protease|nr:C1 family peptidase [Bacteroidia bacterium]
MKKTLHLLVLSLFVCGSIFGQNFVRVNSSHSQKQIHLLSNQALEVSLPSTPATGFGWYLKNPEDSKNRQQGLLKQAGDWEFVSDNPAVPVGAPGTQVIKFVPQGKGTSQLDLVYKRPWEDNSKAKAVFSIQVISDGLYKGPAVVVPKHEPAKTDRQGSSSTTGSLPSSFSWLTLKKCTAVKDQGQCGSCWAFASCASLECVVKIVDNNIRSFSEQWLINCDTKCNACNGGWCPDNMFTGTGGVYEADLPYADMSANGTGSCASSYTYHEKPQGYMQIAASPTDAQIKQAIYDYGPVWACVDAGNNFQNYKSGTVLNSSDGTTLDHAIVLVGWDDAAKCWILRNSWGSSWGENGGYMRIGYGVSGVGGNATYFNYKGIINHNLPPVADFAVNTPTSCSGAVAFKDNSVNSPTTWSWAFGDGSTSTVQNPTHVYTASGTYTVSLAAQNAYGTNTATKNNVVKVSIMTAPTTTGVTRNGPGVVNLSASVSSGAASIDWYASATGGTVLNTGTTYSPNINATTTYYVANENTSPVSSLGLANNSAGGGYYTANTDRRIYFNVLNPVQINSVDVYANTAGARTIVVLNNAGAVVDSARFTAVTGLNTVPVNFTLAPDTGYAMKMSATSAVDLFRNNTGVTYPYSVSGLVSITNSDAATTPGNYYYYFYNWKVQTPVCSSTRTPVTGTVTTITGINDPAQNSGFRFYPNPNNGQFTIDGLNNENIIEVYDIVGKLVYQIRTNNASCTIDIRDKGKGIYVFKVMNTNSKALSMGRIIVD